VPDSLLTVAGVSKRFGGLKAVDQVDFTVERGRLQALIGPNGAGKTTLFNVVSGFLRPEGGRIAFDGHDITRSRPDRIARLGLVRTFQLVRPFAEMTVRENVLVGFHGRTRGGLGAALLRPRWLQMQEAATREEADRILTRVGLADRADEPAGNLTFGQQRFLEIGRALAAGPRLLLADEPGAGLTHEETAVLGRLLVGLRDEGTTVLLVEHDMELVMRVAERIVVLDFGRKIAEGPPAVVRADPAVLTAYLGSDEL
jgi:branched-chain amino acid transport system ATP-binding protein